MRLTSIESSFHPCKFTAIVTGAYPGQAKMCKKSHLTISSTDVSCLVRSRHASYGRTDRQTDTALRFIMPPLMEVEACI